MRISQTYIQKSKAGIHVAQALLIFVGGCLALAVLTKGGETGGQVGFYFGLCFLSIPALVYQIMVPMWTRAWRFANVYAYAAIDLASALLWFAAFIAVAAWEAQGIRQGDKKQSTDDGDGSCSHFAYGSASKCNTSKAATGFGVSIFFLWAVTSAISIHGVIKYRKTGIMPNGNSKKHGQVEHLGGDDTDKDAWSPNTDELDHNDPSNQPRDDDYLDPRRAYGQVPANDEDDALLNMHSRHDSQPENPFQDAESSFEAEDGVHPGRPVSYQSSTNLSIVPPSYTEEAPTHSLTEPSPATGYVVPSALSPSDYHETSGGRVNFPQGDYGRI